MTVPTIERELRDGNLLDQVKDLDTRVHEVEKLLPSGEFGVVSAENVKVAEVSPATFDDLQDWLNNIGSSGYVAGCIITESTSVDGTIDVSLGQGYIKTIDSDIGRLVAFDTAVIYGLSVSDGLNYIYIDYNSDNPQVVVSSSPANHTTQLALGEVYKEVGTHHLHIVQGGQAFSNFQDKTLRMLTGVFGVQRQTGLVTSESTNLARAISMTAGVAWQGVSEYIVSAIDTGIGRDITGAGSGGTVSANNTIVFDSGEGDITTYFLHGNEVQVHDSSNGNDGIYHVESVSWDGSNTTLVIEETTLTTGSDTGHVHDATFHYWYYNGSAWVDDHGNMQIDNLQYNDVSSGLVALTPNRYGVHWVYLELSGELAVVYGRGNYTLAQAEDAAAPASLPDVLGQMAALVAKIVIKQSNASFFSVSLPWDQSFASQSVDDHNDLGALQGGAAGEYYHTTSVEYTAVQVILASQAINTVLAGPASGAPAAPGFRAIVDADIPATITRDTEVATAIAQHADQAAAHHAPVTVSDTDSIDASVTGQQVSAALRRASGGHLSEAAGGVSVDEASETQKGVVELATGTGAPETTVGLAVQAHDAPVMLSANRIVRLDSDGMLNLPGNVWRIGETPLNLDLTGTDYNTKAKCNAVGLRFSDSDTPFPTTLIVACGGSWSHSTGLGWQPAAPNSSEGPAILIPLARPDNWELDVTMTYIPTDDLLMGELLLGYITNSNHVGAAAHVRDAWNADQLRATLRTNDGDDTFTIRYTGGDLFGTGNRTYKFRCQNGCVGVWDDYNDIWNWYTGRPSTGIAYTAAWAVVQFNRYSGTNSFWDDIYLRLLKLSYLL